MNRIIEINTDGAYAVIEPGVTYGQLCKELKTHGYWYPRGSFHHMISVLGPSTTQNHGHRGYGGWDEVCSFEVVIPDGTVVRTGGSMVPKGSWAHQYINFPDIHGLWLNSNGMLGVITKLAVRIYPFGEKSLVHLAGFSNFKASMEFVKKISRASMAQHQAIFWWHGIVLGDFFGKLAKHQQEKIGSIPFEWLLRGRTPPEGIHYNTVMTEMTGYEEVVKASVNVCDRVARELGGEPIPWEEFKEKFPGTAEFVEDYAIKKQPSYTSVNLITKITAAFATIPMVWVGIGSPEKILDVEEFVWEEFAEKEEMGVWFAYCHPFDQGRCFFLRFYTFRFGEAQSKFLEDALKYANFNAKMVEEFGCFPHKPPITELEAQMTLQTTVGYQELLKRIKKVIDPNNIMSPHVSPFREVK
jgi:FAD/FMN-containing dehydrogenase